MYKDFYSIKEFANRLGISTRTVYRAIKSGRINAFRAGSTEKSTLRIPNSEIIKLATMDFKKMIKNISDEHEKTNQ